MSRSWFQGFTDSSWSFFRSPGLSFLSLLFLISGLVMEHFVAHLTQGENQAWVDGLRTVLELDRPHRSWWFMLSAVLLALNLLARSVEEGVRAYRAYGGQGSAGGEDRPGRSVRMAFDGDLGQAHVICSNVLERLMGRVRVRVAQGGGPKSLYAHMGHMSRLGAVGAYLGGTCVAGWLLSTSILSFTGSLWMQEGERITSIPVMALGQGSQSKDIGMDVVCNRIIDQGSAGTALSLSLGGNEIRLPQGEKMRTGSLSLAFENVEDLLPKSVHLAFRGADGRVRDLSIQPRRWFPSPWGGSRTYMVSEFISDYPPGLGPGVNLVLKRGQREVERFWIFKNYPGFDGRARKGEEAIDLLGVARQQMAKVRVTWTVHPVLLWVGGLLMAMGIPISLLIRCKEVWVSLDQGMAQVQVRSMGQREFDYLIQTTQAELAARMDSPCLLLDRAETRVDSLEQAGGPAQRMP